VFDVIVVGSGAAGTHAARRVCEKFPHKKIALLDVGHTPPGVHFAESSFTELLQSKDPIAFDGKIGRNFESLGSITDPFLTPKVKGPLNRFVISLPNPTANGHSYSINSGPSSDCSLVKNGFYAHPSFAMGGLANVWGAQVYQFGDDDLADFCVKRKDLQPYYDDLIAHIGVSGSDDDLQRFFGKHPMQSPIEMNQAGTYLSQRYSEHRRQLNDKNIYMGRPRLAILSDKWRGRPGYDYGNLEYFKTQIPSIYNPVFTLNELRENPQFTYLPHSLVDKYEEHPDSIDVFVTNISSNSKTVFKTKKLFLGAGVFGTSKIVLTSNSDFKAKLPVLDNQIEFVPFLIPALLGQKMDTKGYGTLLSIVLKQPQQHSLIFGCFYSLTAILKSDQLMGIPLSSKELLPVAQRLFPALTVLQLWYPSKANSQNYIQLVGTKLKVAHGSQDTSHQVGKMLIKELRQMGLWSHSALIRRPPPGSSFHWCGSLPMKDEPKPYETDKYGKLFGTNNVYVVDGSVFPTLPAKNLTLTIMALAMRSVDRAMGVN
jgi:choline dehydrogenase-like flavoprotein